MTDFNQGDIVQAFGNTYIVVEVFSAHLGLVNLESGVYRLAARACTSFIAMELKKRIHKRFDPHNLVPVAGDTVACYFKDELMKVIHAGDGENDERLTCAILNGERAGQLVTPLATQCYKIELRRRIIKRY